MGEAGFLTSSASRIAELEASIAELEACEEQSIVRGRKLEEVSRRCLAAEARVAELEAELSVATQEAGRADAYRERIKELEGEPVSRTELERELRATADLMARWRPVIEAVRAQLAAAADLECNCREVYCSHRNKWGDAAEATEQAARAAGLVEE